MQAIPATPAPPQPPPAPAESSSSGTPTDTTHFSRHLKDAQRQADKNDHGKKAAAKDQPWQKTQSTLKQHDSEHAVRDKKQSTDHEEQDNRHGIKDKNSQTDKLDTQKTATNNEANLLQHIMQNSSLHNMSATTDGNAEIIKPVLTDSQATALPTKGTLVPAQPKESLLTSVLTQVTDGSGEEIKINQQTKTTPDKPIIEGWQARFSYTKADATGNQLDKNGDRAATATQTISVGGQTLQASATPVAQQATAPAHGTAGNNIQVPNPPQDANSHFIHSNLPGVTTTNPEAGSGNEQQPGSSDQHTGGNSTLPQAQQTPGLQAGQDIPLVFSLDQSGTAITQTSGSENTTGSLLQLPSGLEIPHSRIIDQVTGQFDMNRTLESGSINIKLHPAELGELRMEIKVKQDNIKAHITAQNPQVQDILDRNLPRLRQALEQQGMNLTHIQVSVASDGGSSNSQMFQEQFNGQQFSHSSHSNTGQTAFALPEEEITDQPVVDPLQNLSVHI